MSGNDSNTISFKRAMELNRYSHNDETMVPSFELCLQECGTPEGVKFMGEILRTNKLIEWLQIDICHKVFPDACFEGVLHFLSHNPSLKVVRIQDTWVGIGNSDEEKAKIADLLHLLVQAASKNQSIEKVTVGEYILRTLPSSSHEEFELSSTLKELELECITEAVVNAWPENHSLQTLRLHDEWERYRPGSYQKSLSALMGKLKDSMSSRRIQYLQLAGWSPTIPTYLFSPNCAIVTLHLAGLNFHHRGDEIYSPMDGLLWGLAGSKRTTTLILDECSFDSLSNQKMIQGLQSNLLGIRRLDFITNNDNGHLDKEFVGQLFGCDQLDSLGFESGVDIWNVEHIDENIDSINRGIEKCSLTSLKLSTDCPAEFGDALMTACTNNALANLTLINCEFSSDAVSCLVSLIEEERSQLRKLTISNFYELVGAELMSSIFKALQGKSKLDTLRLEATGGNEEDMMQGLKESLGELKGLKTLEIFLARKLSLDEEKNIATAMSTNWNVENMQFGGIASSLFDDDNRQGEPIISHGLKTKLEKFTRRNKFKKAIFETPVSLSQAEVKGWLDKLGSVWELPDGFSLAFELLQFRPGCFF